jgi:predicted transcriptional regulator
MALVFDSKQVAARRSAFEVRMDILKATAGGWVKPTHLMYRSNTSWLILQRHLDALQSAGYVQKTGENPRTEYAITERGLAVVRDYVDLVARMTKEPLEASV